MTALRVVLSRLFGRGRRPADLDHEISAHLDLLAGDLERHGMPAAAARAEARRRLGNLTHLHETYREQRRLPFLDTFSRDLAYALRQLRHNPAFAAAAILTLALGIGANVAIYQVLDAVAFRELPVRDPGSLVQVQLLENGSPFRVSYPLFREMSARQQVLEGMFAVSDLPLRQAVLRGRGSMRGVTGSIVTGGYFRILGVTVRVGRMFTEEDDRAGAPPVAVLSDDFWKREFDRSPAALGQTLQINNATVTVIGVAPAGFFGETVGSAPDVWVPMSVQPQIMPADWLNAPSSSWLSMIGRLRPGVSARQAQSALDALYQQASGLTVSRMGRTYRVRLEAANRGIADLQSRFEKPLWLLVGIAGLVLLIACSNIANLLLGRATARGHEIGIRLAMGAGRSRLVRQLLTESLLISAFGALAALPIAQRGSRALIALASGDAWRLPVSFGARAFFVTLAAAILATALFGLAPALAATRLDLQSALQAGRSSTGRQRALLRRGLIVAQIAISLVLLSGATLFTRSLWNLRHQDFGFDATHVLMAQMPFEFTSAIRRRHIALRDPLYESLNALPGVRSAAVSSFGILDSMQHTVRVTTPERPPHPDDFLRMVNVSPRYFETMGLPIVAGRAITAEDRAASPRVVVISQSAARILFGASNPVGRLVSMDAQWNAAHALEVIGVARDVRFGSPREPFGMVFYVPLAQDMAPVTAAVLRPIAGADPLVAPVRAAIAKVDPNVRVGAVRLLAESLDSGLGNDRLLATLSISFGALALALTCIGVYGLIAYAVQRRTREIGVRIALGANRGAIAGMLMGSVARPLVAGLALGAMGAVAGIRAVRGMLFGFGDSDYGMLVAAGTLLAAVAILAGYLPARRAARLDPMDALRQE